MIRNFTDCSEMREPASALEPLTCSLRVRDTGGHCSGLLWLAESSYLRGLFFTGLHTIAENCALGDVGVK
jgi:hypothetical protein